MAMTRQVTDGRMMMLDGSHLFPMEKPARHRAPPSRPPLRGYDFSH